MKYYSQHGQDYWLQHEDSISLTDGYFVDVGASQRKNGYMSNTLFFEKYYNWKGILVEPNEKLSGSLKLRTARLIEVAASNKNGYITFFKGETGATSTVDDKGESIPCKTLSSILEENKAPPTMDLLSVDVEGHERQVLEGINYDKYKFKNIIIEDNFNKKLIVEFLSNKGYIFIEKHKSDLYFSLTPPSTIPSSLFHKWKLLPNKAGLTSY